MRFAITGVTGFIGRHLATRVLEAGHDVTAFSRRAWTGPPFVPLEDRHFLELPARPDPAALRGVDVVVHLAIAPQGGDPEVIDAVNRLGTERMFEAAQREGIGRFIFLSSQSAHEGVESAYGQSKYRIEQLLATEPSAVIVRPGMVYGDTDDGLMGRTTAAAAKLRAFPVIGGRAAKAQPVHVDHLADAILALAAVSDPPHLVKLGDPPVELGELVQSEVERRFGRSPRKIPIPLPVARAGVRVVTKLHVPSPISEANLDGIAAFEPMDTADDEALVAKLVAERPPSRIAVQPVEPRRLLIVGAGRIGLVHALTAAHHPDLVVVGLVDLSRSAMARLNAFIDPPLPTFTDLADAIAAVVPDAAIIGTPPSSHVPIARRLLEAGIDVLVEKPVAVSAEERGALAEVLDAHPERHLATGYLAGLLPHLAALAPDFRAGRFGTPTGIAAHAFVTRIESGVAEQREMWELDPSVSGGGALVNLGVHVLAMIDVLLGPPTVEGAVLVAHSRRATEDAAALRISAGGVTGTFTTAWHLPGFDMPENYLRIDTDRGYLVCTTSAAMVVTDEAVHVVHQADADPGFDLAPMDAGGAFWMEQRLLARRDPGANSLAIAARVEDLIDGVYRTAARVAPPAAEPVLPTVRVEAGPAGPAPDLRGAPPGVASAWVGPALVGTVTGFADDRIVALPDAPGHFRTLTNSGPVALARDLGVTALGVAGLGVSPRGIAARGSRAWEALLLLLRAEARRIPREFRGTLLVDAYIVDLATATGRIDVVAAALDDLRQRCPHAPVGIEVNASNRLVPHVPQIASRLDRVVALGTTRESSLDPLRELLPATVELTVKTGALPREALELAWDEPERWTHGRGRLVVHWPGAPGLRELHRSALDRAERAAGRQELEAFEAAR